MRRKGGKEVDERRKERRKGVKVKGNRVIKGSEDRRGEAMKEQEGDWKSMKGEERRKK